MVSVIGAEQVTLYDLEQQFGLIQVEDDSFFPEWQTALPALTATESQRLDRVRSAYENLARRSMLENTVKLAVVSPLLDLAGFFFPPFYISTEAETQIEIPDQSGVIRGKIDVLVLQEQIWVLVIESKRAELSLKVGIPQALAYLLSSPSNQRSRYGLVTNGSNFVFLKLVQQEAPCYGRSREFVLENSGDLEQVLQIMKHLATLIATA